MSVNPFKRFKRLGTKLGFGRDWHFMLIAGAIGLVMGAVAIAFIWPLQMIEHWAEGADRSLLIWLVPIAPVVGALLTGAVIKLTGKQEQGTGVSAVMYAVYRSKSRLGIRVGIRKWIGSTLTIGSGGSAGAEGPIVTIGSVIGSNIGRMLGANPQNMATLLGCGAAAGIASVFNAPFAGIFFAMEILLRDFSLRTFTPIVIAAVISSAFTRALLGDEALFATHTDFNVGAFTAMEIPNYLLLGLVCGVVAVLFIRSLDWTEGFFSRLRVPTILKPACGAAILGAIGLAYLLINASGTLPNFYGNGYPVISGLLDPASYYEDMEVGLLHPPVGMIGLLVMLAVIKAFATCLTIGSGGEGGLFAPSLLLGAAIGGLMGYIVNWLGWFPAATPAHYALVGMAAVVASTTHAPLTAILMVYEITQSYQIILPLMFAAVISTIFARLLYPDSIYTLKLTRQGVRVGAMSDLTILRRLTVRDVPLHRAVFVHEFDSAQKLLDLTEEHAATDFVVMDDASNYVGLVTSDDLRAALVYREGIPLLQVNELMRTDLPVVGRDETLDVVLDAFSKSEAQCLAVRDESHAAQPSGIVGLITRSRLLAKYQAALTRS
ncbi:MAG TPA: chloride channel protein [Phycisphaerales bacterium]|nr:chloride channel protein [Phycisphaerales bacterium]